MRRRSSPPCPRISEPWLSASLSRSRKRTTRFVLWRRSTAGIASPARSAQIRLLQRRRIDDHATLLPGKPTPHSEQQRAGYYHQAQNQPPPQSARPPTRNEPQVDAQRNAQGPVAEEVGQHRSAGITQASEDAGRHNLEPVENLKDTGNGDQGCGYCDHLGVGGVQPGERVG